MSSDANGNGFWDPLIQIGCLDVIGDSHIAEFGPSIPDFGITQKIAGLLQPSLFRDVAISGAVHSAHDLGNGAIGDGGWAHVATEFARQELVTGLGATTITQTQASGVTSYTITSATGFAPQEWVVLGQGANTEEVQVASSWNGASPLTFATATTKGHTSADPVYVSCRNQGYLAKSIAVMIGTGGNDLQILGPGAAPATKSSTWQSGTFGTTIGASRGLAPFMQALRFTIAQMRCAVIYRDTHPSVIYSGSWTNGALPSALSYPPSYAFGGPAVLNYHFTSTNGQTITFSTPPSFPGGAVNAFFMCWAGSPAGTGSGDGALMDHSVSGATTVAATSHAAGTLYDHRNVNCVSMNDAAGQTTAKSTGCVVRIPNLNAGVNTITLTATTVLGFCSFLGIGLEPSTSLPLVMILEEPRILTNALGGPYSQRTFAGTGATVTAGHGAASGEVSFVGSTLTLATAGTISAAGAQVNDTITLDKGVIGLEETRRIVSFTGSPATACQVDANFVNAHTNAAVAIGLQDADFVGGGYYNVSDTQGASSVPGLAGVAVAIAAEFDSSVLPFSMDAMLNAPGRATPVNPLVYYVDGVHYNDLGSGKVAAGISAAMVTQTWSIPQMASPTVNNTRTYYGVYGDVGATPTSGGTLPVFANGWSNAYPLQTQIARTGFYKDMRTREVTMVLGVTGGVAGTTTIFTLPGGYAPASLAYFTAYTVNEDGSTGVATIMVVPSGAVQLISGYPGATGITVLTAKWLAG